MKRFVSSSIEPFDVYSFHSDMVDTKRLRGGKRGTRNAFRNFLFPRCPDTPVEWRRLICEQVPYRPVNSPYKLATRPRSEIKQYTRALSASDRPFFEQVNVHEIKISTAEAARLNRSHLYKSLIPETSTAIYAGSLQDRRFRCTSRCHLDFVILDKNPVP